MKPEEIISQQAREQLPPPGTHAVDLPGWPGDVPEVHDRQGRETLTEQGWAERQVIILDPHDGIGPGAFLDDRLGKVGIDLLVMTPVERLEHRALEIEVTQGPEGAVGEAIVKPPHLRLTEPEAS